MIFSLKIKKAGHGVFAPMTGGALLKDLSVAVPNVTVSIMRNRASGWCLW